MTTDQELAATLNQLGVHFVADPADWMMENVTPPDLLLSGLASSKDARMRLALIPLLLTHPHYAFFVSEALSRMTKQQRQILTFYYTAAQLLQQIHLSQLKTLFGNNMSLPPMFEESLGLDSFRPASQRLRQLAEKQAEISQTPINWYGTYEHAYERLVSHAQKRKQWQL